MSRALKAKIDWNTVELVGALVPTVPSVAPRVVEEPRLFVDQRGRSIVKKILSGAAAKARARGALYTHAQLRAFLPAGLDVLAYGLGLVAAAMVGDHDVSRGVELAAHAICAASHDLSKRAGT
jgi:hypothetical protein